MLDLDFGRKPWLDLRTLFNCRQLFYQLLCFEAVKALLDILAEGANHIKVLI